MKLAVPTGNFGDILAGHWAKKIGFENFLELVIGTNSNDILTRFFQNGEYAIEGDVHPTLSPSMDIQVSSNFERFLLDVVEGDCERLATLFENLKRENKFQVTFFVFNSKNQKR